jgi:hypothetical protein
MDTSIPRFLCVCEQAGGSLHDLERLELMNFGGMWMSGRLQPDHSTIGKFIQLPRLLADAGYHALNCLVIASLATLMY